MKKLYFLNEDEKNRILNLHENMTQRQYLMETPLTDLYSKLPEESKKKFNALDNSTIPAGTDEKTFLTTLSSLSLNEFNQYNQILSLRKTPYTSFQNMINGEFEKDNWNEVSQVINILKKIGINSTSVKVNVNDFRVGSFKIIPQSTKQPVTSKTVPGTQPSKPQVQPKTQQRNQQIIQQTQNTTKEIQKLLGQNQTGNLDSSNVERMISILNQ